MRRSLAPSVKRQRLGDDENSTPALSISASQSCSTGITLGGFLGVSQSSVLPATANKEQQGGTQGLALQARPAAMPRLQQFKCPLPTTPRSGGTNSSRGTLGMKKNYKGITADLLSAIQRKVFVDVAAQQAAAADPSSASTVSELVLYDPEEHRLQLRGQQQDGGLQDAPAAPTGLAAAPAPAEPAAAAAAAAGPSSSSSSQAAAAAADGAAAGAAAGSAAAASDGQGAVPGTQQVQQQQQQPGSREFGIDWDRRVKVCADAFLVEKLRPHQREGVRFVFECLSGVRQEGVYGAVLADGMGLGKTFQTVASLYSLLTKGIEGKPTCKKPLILCPTSLVQNWGKELKHWLGERVAPVVVDDTRADHVKKSFQDFRSFSHGGKPKVLVMSYPCFRMHKAEVYRMGIDVVMCDEAHFLKNGEAQITQAVSGLAARRRLLMSGTPIQNDLSEFHAVFDLACPALLGDLKAFNKAYEGPIQRGRDADATEKQVALGLERMCQLMKLCNRFMLRRTSVVLKALLPAKVEQVVFCKLSSLQLKLYNAFLNSRPVQTLLASTAVDEQGQTRKRTSAKATKATKAAAAAAAAANALAGANAAAAGGGDGSDDDDDFQDTGSRARAAATLPPAKQPTQHQTQQQIQQTQQQQTQQQQEQQQPQQKEDALAPLVAITALKKLCCHPDLIYQMLNKYKVQAQQKAQQQQLLELMQAQKRVSGRAGTAKNYAALASGAGGDSEDEEDDEGGKKGGKGGKGGAKGKGGKSGGGGRKRGSSGGAAKGPRQQLTGFEGCEGLFQEGDVYPVYKAGSCQAYHSGKVMVLQSLLEAIRESEPTDKVVLVSNYTEALDVLDVMCKSRGWLSLRLDGSCSVKQRQTLVDTFNSPQHPSFVLLLSSKAGGVGLNIIGANRLVLFDPDWNPANDLQAMARVWREGQKKRVWIYRLLTAGSIEEKVLQRQLAKQGLSEALVDEVGQQVRTFSRDELRSLFRVNPTIRCETHAAIKCTCDGSLDAMATCKERAAAAAAGSSSGDGSSSGEPEQQGVMAWAHLANAADSPDPTWQVVKPWARENFVTYVFSDHVLDGADSSGDAGGKKCAGSAAGEGSDGEEEEEEAEEAADSESSEQQEEEDEENEERVHKTPAAKAAAAAAAAKPAVAAAAKLAAYAYKPAAAAASKPQAAAAVKPKAAAKSAAAAAAAKPAASKGGGSSKARGSGRQAEAAAQPAAAQPAAAALDLLAAAAAADAGDAGADIAQFADGDAEDMMLMDADLGGGDDDEWFQ